MRIVRNRDDWSHEPPLPRLLTTADVAKELDLSRFGVLWLAHQGDLPFERTRSGQLIFHIADVRRVLLHRGDARTRSRRDVLAAIHLRMAKSGIEPHQLSFWRGPGLHIVARGERSLNDRAVKAPRSFEEIDGSEKQSYVDRKVARR